MSFRIRVDERGHTLSGQFGAPNDPNVLTVSVNIKSKDREAVNRMLAKVERWLAEQSGEPQKSCVFCDRDAEDGTSPPRCRTCTVRGMRGERLVLKPGL